MSTLRNLLMGTLLLAPLVACTSAPRTATDVPPVHPPASSPDTSSPQNPLEAPVEAASEDEPVPSDTAWTMVTASKWHTCGLQQDGSLWCWGGSPYHHYGQLGLGEGLESRLTPGRVGDARWTLITTGAEHTCGIQEDQTLWCWGRGSVGRLGLGEDSSDRHVPARVGNESDWISVAAGLTHTCAIREDQSLFCWGSGSATGHDDFIHPTEPTPVDGDHRWIKVAIGAEDTCAIGVDGTLWCWGTNHSGKLGHGLRQRPPALTHGPRYGPTHEPDRRRRRARLRSGTGLHPMVLG